MTLLTVIFRELGYYTGNGIDQILENDVVPEPYLPYPKYNSIDWKQEWKGEHAPCEGPRGLDVQDSIQDIPKAWRSRTPNFPAPSVGSFDVVGLNEDVCFDRFNRYSAFGYGLLDDQPHKGWEKPQDQPYWSDIRWGQLQDSCLLRNKHRYMTDARAPMNLASKKELSHTVDFFDEHREDQFRVQPAYHPRTAVLFRTWEGYRYQENDLQAIRALITELSLLSGAEYQVFLFVNVKQKDADIYNDPAVYKKILHESVPEEFRDIAILWTEKICEEWYPYVGDWQVYWQQFMPVQWFSKTHPEFDYVWNWETDARYTGNHYEFLEKMAEFSRNMPRKNMWERNARFYFPESHANYGSFLADTDHAIANATAMGKLVPAWGPQHYAQDQIVFGPTPPRSYEEDNFEWGVGEEADLITLQPMWDPSHTQWSYRYKIWNFVKGKRPNFTPNDPGDDAYYHPDFDKIPRRTFINTVVRFSSRMLHAMHMENRAGRAMQAEMWPATVALQHGLKAIYSPHPIWLDRKWPSWFLEATFNADHGEPAAWGQRNDSAYNHDREAAYRGWSWYYSTWFPRVLYRRWLGWRARDILGDVGGADYEDHAHVLGDLIAGAEGSFAGGKGRMCLPAMLLHPVKNVREDGGEDPQCARATDEDRRKERVVSAEVQKHLQDRGFYWPDDVVHSSGARVRSGADD